MLFFYEGNANKPGIYEIRNRKTNRSYIGQASRFKERINNGYKSNLKHNKCHNSHLQNDYNKCREELGHDDFLEFHILELMESSTKRERSIQEEYWIRLYKEKGYSVYNFREKDSANPPHETRSRKKTFIVASPSNEIITFTGIRDFCRQKELHYSSFCQMLNGQVPSSNGWRLPANIDKQINQTTPKRFPDLLNPFGELIKDIFNLEKFCKQHGLVPSAMRHLYAGRCKSVHGWKVAGREIKQRSNLKTYFLLSPNGELITITNLPKFCIENGLKYGSITAMLSLSRKFSIKGWSKP